MGIVVSVVIGTAVAVVSLCLTAVGFAPAGIAAGSLAASIQSTIGTVAAGSMFATLQSLGASGALAIAGTVGAGVAAIGASAWMLTTSIMKSILEILPAWMHH